MASELRVNTLKDANGNNSIATSIVAGGSAKAWVNFDGGSITDPASTTGVRTNGSFGLTSMLDRGTGLGTMNLSVTMSNANYAGTTSCMGTNGDDDGRNYIAVAMPQDATKVYVNQFTTGGSAADAEYVAVHIMGDLA